MVQVLILDSEGGETLLKLLLGSIEANFWSEMKISNFAEVCKDFLGLWFVNYKVHCYRYLTSTSTPRPRSWLWLVIRASHAQVPCHSNLNLDLEAEVEVEVVF